MKNATPSIGRMILVPAIITLAITLLRLVGELQQWNETFFRRSPGGSGAIVGIAWLAAVFAIYFALKLRKTDRAMQSKGKAIGLSVLALILFIGGTFLMYSNGQLHLSVKMVLGLVVIASSICVMRSAWPAYWSLMMSYSLAARVPVLIVMYLAMNGNWGTHYDAAPPDRAFPDLTAKYVELALAPQIFFWIPYTVILCGLIGIIVASIGKLPERIDAP